ncbi:MAG TPA: hypothetical protein VLF65_11025 [Burkholderiales bacterium]|jgi:hypothetical protein|nr:hypothetical protein [Burkholderiales bacterium]
MFTFADDERASLGWMRGITQDPQGRAVLVGLTFEETDEIARLERVGTEIHLRNENPIRQ